MPKVSIIIPTYNSANFLYQTINSVFTQTYTDFEIIIVDDGSTDNTREIVSQYSDKVNYIYQLNQERSIARNNGVAHATGEYLVFLDSDDLLLPNKLQSQVAALDAQPTLGLVAGGFQYIDSNGKVLREEKSWLHQPDITLETLLFNGLTPPHALMLRRYWFDAVGGFDARFIGPEDMDLWFRLILAGCNMGWDPCIVCQYRIHGKNFSRNIQKHYDDLFVVLEQLYSRSDLPNSIRDHQVELHAHILLAEAGRLYGAGLYELAAQCVQSALDSNPDLSANNFQKIIPYITAWNKSVWVLNNENFIQDVFKYIPRYISISPGFRKRVMLNCQKAAYYDAYEMKDSKTIRKLWPIILLLDLAWLWNRGGWSILFRSLRWPKKT